MNNLRTVKAIMACDSKFGIAKNGTLPWPKNSDDLREFRDLTTGSGNNMILMGSKTWTDPVFPKPLPNRKKYVLSRNQEFQDSRCFPITMNHHEAIQELIEECKINDTTLWVIGGSEILKMMIPYIEEFHLTQFNDDFQCDTFIPNPLDLGFTEKSYEVRSDCVKYVFTK